MKDKMISIPLEVLETENVTERVVEKAARGYIMGTTSIGHSQLVRKKLEDKVVKRIGRKGKYLTDKLFELIDGIYMVDKRTGKGGMAIKYYKTPPSLSAITYALDRVLGKPTVHTENTEERRGVLLVEHIIKNLANGRGNENTTRGRVGGEAARGGFGAYPAEVDEGVGAVAL
jgi:hypothetical protein